MKKLGIILIISIGFLFAVNSVNSAVVKDKITFDENYTPIGYNNYSDIEISEVEYQYIENTKYSEDTNFQKDYVFKKFYGNGLKKKVKVTEVRVAVILNYSYTGRNYLNYNIDRYTDTCYDYDIKRSLVKITGKGYNKKYKIKNTVIYTNLYDKKDKIIKGKTYYKVKNVYKKVKWYKLKNYIISNSLIAFTKSKANGKVIGEYWEYKPLLKTQDDLKDFLGDYFFHKATKSYIYYKYVAKVGFKYKKINWKSYYNYNI